jgi:N-acetyl-1-D-myo-inositol-2-amino-2-deoxy-alpha-D-glucopyranoside deacetylase
MSDPLHSHPNATEALAAAGATRPARLLFVHAHPDDETLTTGITMASYASGGHDVHLLTCTLGEEGEVIPPALAHLAAGLEDRLGPWRREELRAAMSSLGVSCRVLGEDTTRGVASRYRDSGMAGTASAGHPDAFAGADPIEASAMVAAHIWALRPDIVVTYDEQGGYLHPDHVQTHRVTMSALASLAAEYESQGVSAPRAFCILTPQTWAAQDRDWLRVHASPLASNSVAVQQESIDSDGPFPPSVVADEIVTHAVQDPTLVPLQSRALAHHVTQVSVRTGYYALSNNIPTRLSGREGFAEFDPVAGQLVARMPGAARVQGLLQQPDGSRQQDPSQQQIPSPSRDAWERQGPRHQPVAAQRKARG